MLLDFRILSSITRMEDISNTAHDNGPIALTKNDRDAPANEALEGKIPREKMSRCAKRKASRRKLEGKIPTKKMSRCAKSKASRRKLEGRVRTSKSSRLVERPSFFLGFNLDYSGGIMNKYFRLSPKEEEAIKMEYKLLGAACDGYIEEITELLTLGVSVNADKYNSSGLYGGGHRRTPLQVAVAGGHVECIRLLLIYGADPNAADDAGITPLMLAAVKGDLCSLKILLSARAQCNSVTHFSISHPVTQEVMHISTTALHLATAGNHIACVRELIQSGADCSIQDCRGRTSIYIAAELGFSECILTHIDNATNHDFLSLESFNTMNTPLHLAIRLQLEDCVQALVRHGADVNILNDKDHSALYLALMNADGSKRGLKILRIILMEGHNPDITTHDLSHFPGIDFVCSLASGIRPLNETCCKWGCHRYRCSEVAELLLARGVEANIHLGNACTLLEHELNTPDEEFELLKRIVDVLPPNRSCNNLSLTIPQEFTVDPCSRKFFTRSLLDYLRNRPLPSTDTSRERICEIYLSSDEQKTANGLRIFWPPDGIVSEVLAETYVALHLSNTLRVACLSRERFISELYQLWMRWCIYLKHKWYYDTTRNARSLKNSCRYAVRKTLSGSNIPRNVKTLDIPVSLQSYLLFFEDTY